MLKVNTWMDNKFPTMNLSRTFHGSIIPQIHDLKYQFGRDWFLLLIDFFQVDECWKSQV
jgi:hypothetical protein